MRLVGKSHRWVGREKAGLQVRVVGNTTSRITRDTKTKVATGNVTINC